MSKASTHRSTHAHETTADEKAFMRRVHGLGWHAKAGWNRRFPGDGSRRTSYGRVPPGEAVAADRDEHDRRARIAAGEVQLANLNVRDAVNLFLSHLDQRHAAGQIGAEQRASYGHEIDLFIRHVGKARMLSDFARPGAPGLFAALRTTAVKRGLAAAEKHVVQVRTFFDWCSDVRRFMPPPFYGGNFDQPSEKEKRAARKTRRKDHGAEAYWTPGEVREVIEAARADGVHRLAHVLLMVNGGMGATDLSNLDDADVDFTAGCIRTDRSKTLVPRVVPLWPETITAMQASRAERAAAKLPEWAKRFFLTSKGRPLVEVGLNVDAKARGRKTRRTDTVRNWFFRLLNAGDTTHGGKPALRLKHLKRHGAGAYTLRSVFASLAQGCADADATLIAVVMGHKLPVAIMQHYLKGNLLDKLKVVTTHVRRQIWPVDGTG